MKGGPLLASSTGIYVTMRGVGGHGSSPQSGKDPIVLAAEFVLVAQTIVSRQIDPQQPAVLTVGTIHGGTKNNIIPDEVTLGLTLRTYSPEVRDQIIADIRRTANGLAEAYGIPSDRMPVVTLGESTPPTLNDSAMVERMRAVATAALGKERVLDAHAVMGSEDVGLFTLDGKIPGAMYWLGAADPDKLAQSKKSGVLLPSPHSALFAPVYAPAITSGVTAMTAIATPTLEASHHRYSSLQAASSRSTKAWIHRCAALEFQVRTCRTEHALDHAHKYHVICQSTQNHVPAAPSQ